MSKTTVLELLEQIAETVVFMDLDSPAGFSTVAADLTTLAARLAEEQRPQEAAICTNAAHLAGGLAGGLGHAESAIKVLIAGIDALRASLGNECHPEDAGFPSELSTAPTEDTADDDHEVDARTQPDNRTEKSAAAPASAVLEKPGRRDSGSARTSTSSAIPAAVSAAITPSTVARS